MAIHFKMYKRKISEKDLQFMVFLFILITLNKMLMFSSIFTGQRIIKIDANITFTL